MHRCAYEGRHDNLGFDRLCWSLSLDSRWVRVSSCHGVVSA